MTARLPLTARIGLALILIGTGWFCGWARWAATRKWVPVDVPVSLSQGRIRTPEFEINIEGTYLFQIEVGPEFDVEGGPCLAGFRCPSALSMSWSLWNGGRVACAADKFPAGRILGGFNVDKGRYVLDLDIREDGSRLNAGAPHLVVFEAGPAYAAAGLQESRAFLLLLVFSAVGVCLIVRAAIARRQEALDTAARACALTRPGAAGSLTASARAYVGTSRVYQPGKPQPPRGRPFARTPSFGLVAAITFLLVLIPMWVLQSWSFIGPVGLRIHLWRPGIVAPPSPGMQPLLVRLESRERGRRPNLFVDSQSVTWEDFGSLLRRKLVQRPPGWPVYLQGDADMEWQWAVKAIEIIRGQGPEVVLLKAAASSGRR